MMIYAQFKGMNHLEEDQSYIQRLSFGNMGFPEAVVVREVIWPMAKQIQDEAVYEWTCQGSTTVQEVIDSGMFNPLVAPG